MRTLVDVALLIGATLALGHSSHCQNADSQYKLGPDSEVHASVPKGTVTKHRWESKLYDGVHREYYVYLPAQYDPKKPAIWIISLVTGIYPIYKWLQR